MQDVASQPNRVPPRGIFGSLSFLYQPKFRSIAFQLILLLILVGLFYSMAYNLEMNLRAKNIASGFDFLNHRSGFEINQTLISYSPDSSYGRAFCASLLNTLVVAAFGIVLATFLGFPLGVARLSRNFICAKLATCYVETIRNIPLLLQLLFWYKAVLRPLGTPKNSLVLPFGIYLNNRGIFFPEISLKPYGGFYLSFFLFVIILLPFIAYKIAQRQRNLGQPFSFSLPKWTFLVGLTLVSLVCYFSGIPLVFLFPELKGFNFQGGVHIRPEFVALLLGLVLYTSAFIAEIVRAGVLAVSPGQREAAYALGFSPGLTSKLIVMPQALRLIIPPLTSQYLNITKNSSLAVFVGYPDLVNVFAGSVLNQTGQALEVMGMTMMVYLTISLLTSLFMNWFNKRRKLIER